MRFKLRLLRNLARAAVRERPSAREEARLSGRSLARLLVTVRVQPSAPLLAQALARRALRIPASVISPSRPRRSSLSNLKKHLRSKGSNPELRYFLAAGMRISSYPAGRFFAQ